MKKRHFRTLLSAMITIILSITIISGSTFALFASNDKVNIAVTSGKVQITANIDKDSLKVYSKDVEQTLTDTDGAKLFENGGTASFDAQDNLVLARVTPGDKAEFKIDVKNESNVAVLYRVHWAISGSLASVLVATVDGETIASNSSDWAEWDITEGYEKSLTLSIELPMNVPGINGEQYQDQSALISYSVEAVQANADLPDEWDGTADTTWYNETDTEFTLSTAEQLAGLAKLISDDITFVGKTIKLESDINLFCEDTTPSADGDPLTFRPIADHSKNGTFEGIFDGQGHAISNLYQNGWDLGYDWDHYGSYGLFGEINNATIKNLTITGTESYIEGGDVSFIAGSATGECTFENITIKDSTIATYNNGCGGIIGWSGAGTYTFKNITLGEDVVLGGLWGSFDSSIGGIVGQAEPGATYNFENVEINCRIDAYNDCTASYDYYNYRMCGMIIGRMEETTTIEGTNYPDTSKYTLDFNNVTVNYGDWMNYHYCRAEGARAKRVEAGYAYDGISTDYDHSVCTVHHLECIPFNQIFGGDQFGVKGLDAYAGVTVNHPASYNPNNN